MRAALLALLVACGGGEDAPSCQQAVTHYYDSGCVLTDNGEPRSVDSALGLCQQLLAVAPPQCEDDLADFRSCLGGVPTPSTTNADCDCSPEIDALITCE